MFSSGIQTLWCSRWNVALMTVWKLQYLCLWRLLCLHRTRTSLYILCAIRRSSRAELNAIIQPQIHSVIKCRPYWLCFPSSCDLCNSSQIGCFSSLVLLSLISLVVFSWCSSVNFSFEFFSDCQVLQLLFLTKWPTNFDYRLLMAQISFDIYTFFFVYVFFPPSVTHDEFVSREPESRLLLKSSKHVSEHSSSVVFFFFDNHMSL